MDRKIFLTLLLGLLILFSCNSDPEKSNSPSLFQNLIDEIKGPQPWPPDSKSKLYNSIGKSFDKNVFNGSEFDRYIECLLNSCKNKYPDFRKFEKALDENNGEIVLLSIGCLKQVYGQDFNSIFKILSNNAGIATIKNNLSPSLFNKYKVCLTTKLKNEFNTVDNFYKQLFTDQERVSATLQRIDNECGQEIAEIIRIEESNVLNLQQLLNTPIENLNVELGYYEVINETRKSVKIVLGYYYYGLRWKGWVSEGWILLAPGEIIKVFTPLNNLHQLNSIVYFHATTEGASWSGENGFAVGDENFKIPNADLYTTYSDSPNFLKFIFKFKKKQFDYGSTSFTLRLTN